LTLQKNKPVALYWRVAQETRNTQFVVIYRYGTSAEARFNQTPGFSQNDGKCRATDKGHRV
jgi:hypothetical protein